MAQGREFVDSVLGQQKKVTIFSKSYCPFCKKAISAINQLVESNVLSKDDVLVEQIENRDDCEKIMDYLHQLTGGRTVPRVFIKGKFYGGGDDTDAGVKSGKLAALL